MMMTLLLTKDQFANDTFQMSWLARWVCQFTCRRRFSVGLGNGRWTVETSGGDGGVKPLPF